MPTALKLKEMLIKTSMRDHQIIFVRMSIIKKTRGNKCWQGCGEKRTLYIVSGNVTGVATMKNSIEAPQ